MINGETGNQGRFGICTVIGSDQNYKHAQEAQIMLDVCTQEVKYAAQCNNNFRSRRSCRSVHSLVRFVGYACTLVK